MLRYFMKVPEASCYPGALSSQTKVPPFKEKKTGRKRGREIKIIVLT
jgi:hypothetical protein